MDSVIVMGHVPPDTDTVCSPIAYAWYLTNKKEMSAKAVIGGDLNNETKFVLDYFKVEIPEIISELKEGDEVIFIDSNNPEELIKGYEKANILEIVDHHKLTGGLTTNSPINFTLRTVGCSATILWEIMERNGDTNIPKEIAGLMLSGIISDTLKFQSPTTTPEDERVANILANKCEVQIDEFASQMFDAKSSLKGLTAKDILKIDSKVFEFNGKRVRISVLETVRPSLALSMERELKEAMLTIKADEGLDALFFFVVDIIENGSVVIACDERVKEITSKAFKKDFVSDIIELPGVVSRKKQIVPVIEEAYNE